MQLLYNLIESKAKQMYPKRPGTGVSIFPVLCSIKRCWNSRVRQEVSHLNRDDKVINLEQVTSQTFWIIIYSASAYKDPV